MFLEPWQGFFYGYSVYPSRAMVPLDTLVNPVQMISVQNRFQQVTCTASFFSFSAVSTLRFCILFEFHTTSLQKALVSSVYCGQHNDFLLVCTIVQPFSIYHTGFGQHWIHISRSYYDFCFISSEPDTVFYKTRSHSRGQSHSHPQTLSHTAAHRSASAPLRSPWTLHPVCENTLPQK